MDAQELLTLILKYPKRRAALTLLYEVDNDSFVDLGTLETGHANWLARADLIEIGDVPGQCRITSNGKRFVEAHLWGWISKTWKLQHT